MREGGQRAPEASPSFPRWPRRKGQNQGWSSGPVCTPSRYPACDGPAGRGCWPHLSHTGPYLGLAALRLEPFPWTQNLLVRHAVRRSLCTLYLQEEACEQISRVTRENVWLLWVGVGAICSQVLRKHWSSRGEPWRAFPGARRLCVLGQGAHPLWTSLSASVKPRGLL